MVWAQTRDGDPFLPVGPLMQFMCCGSLSYEEWRTSEWHRYQGLSHFRESDVPTIPPSCCNMTADDGNETQPLDLMKCSHRDAMYPNNYMFSQVIFFLC